MFLGSSTPKERKEVIFERIRFALNDDNMTDSEAVGVLLKGAYVMDGKSAWFWLRKYYEQRLLKIYYKYMDDNADIAKRIDEITQKLKGWKSKRGIEND